MPFTGVISSNPHSHPERMQLLISQVTEGTLRPRAGQIGPRPHSWSGLWSDPGRLQSELVVIVCSAQSMTSPIGNLLLPPGTNWTF